MFPEVHTRRSVVKKWHINLYFSDILMRAERKSTSHLVNLVNIASGRSTMKRFLCYHVNFCILHTMMPFHADFPNNVIPHNIQIRIPVHRNTYTL